MHCPYCSSPLDARGICRICYRRRCAHCGGVLYKSQSIWLRPYGDAVHLDGAHCAEEKARQEAAAKKTPLGQARPRCSSRIAATRRRRCAA